MTNKHSNNTRRIYILQSVLAGLTIVMLLQVGAQFGQPMQLSGSTSGDAHMYGPPPMPKVSKSSVKTSRVLLKKKKPVRKIRSLRRSDSSEQVSSF